MVTTDARRKKSAFSLLGQIEVWRLEYGRPNLNRGILILNVSGPGSAKPISPSAGHIFSAIHAGKATSCVTSTFTGTMQCSASPNSLSSNSASSPRRTPAI